MGTYDELVEKHKESWSPEAHALAEMLGLQLDEQIKESK